MTEVRSPSQTHHGDAPAPRAAAGGVPLAPPSVFSFSAKYFCCTECRAFLDDPVCLVPAERGFACRTCANTARQDSTELPPAFALAMAELRSLQKQFGDNSDAMPRKVIRGKRPMKASDAFQSPQKLLDPATNVFVHIVQSAMQPANVATASALSSWVVVRWLCDLARVVSGVGVWRERLCSQQQRADCWCEARRCDRREVAS